MITRIRPITPAPSGARSGCHSHLVDPDGRDEAVGVRAGHSLSWPGRSRPRVTGGLDCPGRINRPIWSRPSCSPAPPRYPARGGLPRATGNGRCRARRRPGARLVVHLRRAGAETAGVRRGGDLRVLFLDAALRQNDQRQDCTDGHGRRSEGCPPVACCGRRIEVSVAAPESVKVLRRTWPGGRRRLRRIDMAEYEYTGPRIGDRVAVETRGQVVELRDRATCSARWSSSTPATPSGCRSTRWCCSYAAVRRRKSPAARAGSELRATQQGGLSGARPI
jgi:hypothetical protein